MLASDPLVIERYAGAAEGQGVLLLKGPLVTENLYLFHSAMRVEDSPTIVLDMTNVPYIDSAGLGSLITAYVSRQKTGHRVALAGVNKRVLRLFEITKVEPLFLIFPTLGDALEAFTSAGQA
jgi:anti-sigma B factor antagonist